MMSSSPLGQTSSALKSPELNSIEERSIASSICSSCNRKAKPKRSVTIEEPSHSRTSGYASAGRRPSEAVALTTSIEIHSPSDNHFSSNNSHLHPHLHELHEYDDSDQLNFLPIVYSPVYDIHFFKIQKIHPFDSKKWGRIAAEVTEYLTDKNGSHSCHRRSRVNFLAPKRIITKEELQVIHTQKFVDRIHGSKTTVIRATEVALLAFLPMRVITRRLLTPLKWQVSGSILAGKVALDHGWSIHLGGGFHHCCSETPGGFCLFADISLMIKFIWNHVNPSYKFLILDLDAHQGNGHERDVLFTMTEREQSLVYIMDVFNADIYPHDDEAKDGINRCIEIKSRTVGQVYNNLVSFHLKAALDDFSPDLVIYNAGTDILDGDPLGKLSVDFEAVVKRDQIVFTEVMFRRSSIVMLTSGGYHRQSASVVAASIKNLFNLKLIS